MKLTTWSVHVHMEKGGRFAEYLGPVKTDLFKGRPVTEKEVIAHVKGMIVNEHPEMKSGRVVHSSARITG